MLTNSRDIKRRWEHEGWILERVAGSHHVFKHPVSCETVACLTRRKTWAADLCKPTTRRQNGSLTEGIDMPHYVAVVEDAGPDKTVGFWFPDLPGCFSAGDDIDDALRNAAEALALYAESLAKEGRPLPAPRSISVLRDDPAVAPDLREHVVALVAFPVSSVHAAE
ncbi:MAG: type II toxin-antitoxin system HicB family antitoxin [Xanthobacteraceae bacterium]